MRPLLVGGCVGLVCTLLYLASFCVRLLRRDGPGSGMGVCAYYNFFEIAHAVAKQAAGREGPTQWAIK